MLYEESVDHYFSTIANYLILPANIPRPTNINTLPIYVYSTFIEIFYLFIYRNNIKLSCLICLYQYNYALFMYVYL